MTDRAGLLRTVPGRRFYYLRHGKTDWNASRRLQGQLDVPLNAEGVAEAEAAAELLAGVHLDAIVSSPLERAAETARIVARRRDCPPAFHDALMERNFGTLTGKYVADVHREHGLRSQHDLHHLEPDAGESFLAMVQRFVSAVRGILSDHAGDVLIVGHGGLYRSFMWLLTGEPEVCRNATPYLFERTDEGRLPQEVKAITQ